MSTWDRELDELRQREAFASVGAAAWCKRRVYNGPIFLHYGLVNDTAPEIH